MAESMTEPVKTFSIGFDEGEFDERRHAWAVAQRFATDHHELVVRPSALDVLDALTWYYDEPFADSSAIPSYYLAAMTREQVTVALNGDGGDESFGGYRRYLTNLRATRWGPPAGIRPAVARLASAHSGVAFRCALAGRTCEPRARALGRRPMDALWRVHVDLRARPEDGDLQRRHGRLGSEPTTRSRSSRTDSKTILGVRWSTPCCMST